MKSRKSEKAQSARGYPEQKTRCRSRITPAMPAERVRSRVWQPRIWNFDYDRAQLRDPRPTPGRRARPRYDEFDIPADLKEHLLSSREVPKPEKSKGRLNRVRKDQLFKEESLMNPLSTFHDLDRCHQKGREGSPTYDSAGFQLESSKVANWMKPTPYSKQNMIRGMDRAIEKSES